MVTVPQPNIRIEDDRTGLDVETLRRAFADNLFYIQGKFPEIASNNDFYLALAYTVRDRLMNRWLHSTRTYLQNDARIVCYLSAEFLLGPHLENNLINLGVLEQVKQAVEESGLNYRELIDRKKNRVWAMAAWADWPPAIWTPFRPWKFPPSATAFAMNLAFLTRKFATAGRWKLPINGCSLATPGKLLGPTSPSMLGFGGHTEPYTDSDGQYRVRWVPGQIVKAIPYDTPILGYRVNTTNTLRLWRSEAPESFDFQAFNVGDYYRAVDEKVVSENISKVLYPNDEPIQGKELRLEQQYFFVSSSLQDMIRIHLGRGRSLETFHEKFAVQLNDTHPAIGVAELMRLLVDEHQMEWDKAWEITQNTFAFTNHTLLPEALEKWPIDLFGRLLPRHLEIIFEINRRFLDEVRMRFPWDGHLENLS
jgi:starch phosphorylase